MEIVKMINLLLILILLINCKNSEILLNKESSDILRIEIENDSVFFSWNNEKYYQSPQKIKYKIINNSSKDYVLPFNKEGFLGEVDYNLLSPYKHLIGETFKPKISIIDMYGNHMIPDIGMGNNSCEKTFQKISIQNYLDNNLIVLKSKSYIELETYITFPTYNIDCSLEKEDSNGEKDIYDYSLNYLYVGKNSIFSINYQLHEFWEKELSNGKKKWMKDNGYKIFIGNIKSNKVPIIFKER